MKDKTARIAITEFIWLKPRMCSFLVGNSVAMKMKTFCWIIHVWDTQWIKFKAKTIE